MTNLKKAFWNTFLAGLGMATSFSCIADTDISKVYVCSLGSENITVVTETLAFADPRVSVQGKNSAEQILLNESAEKLGYDLTPVLSERNREAYLRFDDEKSNAVVDFYFVNPGTFERTLEGSLDCRG